MLISEFVRRTGLARETVRYYVRFGLLQPQATNKGGRHPYLMFTDEDVHSADIIRVGHALGLSLRKIVELRKARRGGDLPRKKRIALMQDQLARLEAKAAELEKLKSYAARILILPVPSVLVYPPGHPHGATIDQLF
jgi:MerR family transcriptional regulator, copper efflux regulator